MASYLHWLGKHLPPAFMNTVVNLWPPFLGMGIKLEKKSPDFRYVETSLTLHWYNTNYVGVHFGGAIYSLTDPFYMLMLMQNLGKDYIVWDKAAQIDFKKPGTGVLRAIFSFSAEEIQVIRHEADTNEKYIFDKPVQVLNEQGEIVASVIKTLYVRRKDKKKINHS